MLSREKSIFPPFPTFQTLVVGGGPRPTCPVSRPRKPSDLSLCDVVLLGSESLFHSWFFCLGKNGMRKSHIEDSMSRLVSAGAIPFAKHFHIC